MNILEKIFQKKMDIEKDCLRVEFNSNEKKYNVYYGIDLVPYESLSKQSKKVIDKKNNDLMINSDLLRYELEQAAVKRRFNKLKSLGFSCDSFEYLGVVNGTMSKQMEELLNRLISEEDVLLGIHRIGINDSVKKIEDILINGLEISGHLGGVAQSSKELKNNVGYYADNKKIIKELMYADQYKNSQGSILIRIPDVDLTQNIFVVDANGRTRLNPKYIVGYVPLEHNHHIETIITAESIRKANVLYNYNFQNDTNEEYQYYQEDKGHKIRR